MYSSPQKQVVSTIWDCGALFHEAMMNTMCVKGQLYEEEQQHTET